MNKKKDIWRILLTFILVCSTSVPISGNLYHPDQRVDHPMLPQGISQQGDAEYWALIIGVGVYADYPWENISSILDANNMYQTLFSSGFWHPDHMKLITGVNATKANITEGFRWLDSVEDENDIVLIYLASHGGSLSFLGRPIDVPPFDETDKSDEVLVTYYGFKHPLREDIRDDEVNYYLNQLESHAICVIIDCCHAGGFNDAPRTKLFKNEKSIQTDQLSSSSSRFAAGFIEDISKEGRIILMGTREDQLGWGYPDRGGIFTLGLLESLQGGYGDFNNDGYISAEEALRYTQLTIVNQNPTICDWYDGEFIITPNTKHQVDYVDDFEQGAPGWVTEDDSGGISGDLWHLSDFDSHSSSHCWRMQNENTHRYNNSMNDSLMSPVIQLGGKPMLHFVYRGCVEEYRVHWTIQTQDFLNLDITTDNWHTYKTKKFSSVVGITRNGNIKIFHYLQEHLGI